MTDKKMSKARIPPLERSPQTREPVVHLKSLRCGYGPSTFLARGHSFSTSPTRLDGLGIFETNANMLASSQHPDARDRPRGSLLRAGSDAEEG